MKAETALIKIAKLHQPTTARAWVNEWLYGAGRCGYCDKTELLKEFKTVHYHVDPHPVCTTCSYGYDWAHPYPCKTAEILEKYTDE